MDPNSSSTPNGGPDPASAGGVLRRAGSATVAGAKAAAPVVASGAAHSWSFFQQRVMPLLKRVFGRIGDWLATVGWGKFALVAILLLAAAGIATNVLYDEGPVLVVDRKAPKENVKVDIKVGPDGIRIERPGVPKPPSPPKAPEAPRPPDAPRRQGRKLGQHRRERPSDPLAAQRQASAGGDRQRRHPGRGRRNRAAAGRGTARGRHRSLRCGRDSARRGGRSRQDRAGAWKVRARRSRASFRTR